MPISSPTSSVFSFGPRCRLPLPDLSPCGGSVTWSYQFSVPDSPPPSTSLFLLLLFRALWFLSWITLGSSLTCVSISRNDAVHCCHCKVSKLKFHHFPVEFEFFDVSTLLSGQSPHPFTWHPGHSQRPHHLPCLPPLFPQHCSLIPCILCRCHLCLGCPSAAPPDHPSLFLGFLFTLTCYLTISTQATVSPHLPWLPVLLFTSWYHIPVYR